VCALRGGVCHWWLGFIGWFNFSWWKVMWGVGGVVMIILIDVVLLSQLLGWCFVADVTPVIVGVRG